MRKHIIAVCTVKGGTAKTTTAAILAEAAVLDGKRALVVDLDPQCNISLLFRAEKSTHNAFSVLEGESATEAIQHTAAGVDIIRGSGNLAAATVTKTHRNSARRLEAALAEIAPHYDFMMIDTGAGMGEVLNNAIWAASEVLVPVNADLLSIQGLNTALDLAARVAAVKREQLAPAVLVTQFDPRPIVNREAVDVIKQTAAEAGAVYLGEIRKTAKVSEAVMLGRPLLEYAPQCTAAADYLRVYETIKRRRTK